MKNVTTNDLVLYYSIADCALLSEKIFDVEPIPEQRRPGPRDIPYGIPEREWQIVLARVGNHESYRTIAKDYQVSRETIRRFVQASKQAG